MARRQLDPEIKEKARLLFYKFVSYPEIAEACGVTKQTVINWASNEDWHVERDAFIANSLEVIKTETITQVVDVFKISLPMIVQSLQKRKESGKALSIAETKMLTDILTSFDKLIRLEKGKPTEITEIVESVTIEDLRNAVAKDQFIEIKEVESEVEDPRGDDGS